MNTYLFWLDLSGVCVFAISGALVASRKQLDLVGFGLLGTVTGIGGGTLRDLLLGLPVSWISSPVYLLVCLLSALAVFFLAPVIRRRFIVLLWLDAAGLALFCVLGTSVALTADVHWSVAIVMGVMTATFGGIIRDVIGNELPLVLRKELYVTCAAAGAGAFSLALLLSIPLPLSQLIGFGVAFGLRALGLLFNLSLPNYRERPGRDYPDQG